MKTVSRTLYRWLLRPSNVITDDIHRSKATTAAAITLLLIFFAWLNAWLFSPEFWGDDYHWWQDVNTIAAVAAGAALLIPYAMMRTRYYRIGMWILVILPSVSAFAQNIAAVAANEGFQGYAFYYLIFSPLLAMILFGAREVFIAGLSILIALVAWYAVLQNQVLDYGYTDAFFYSALVSPLVMFAAFYWSRLEGKRRKELEHLLRQAEDANRLKTEFLTIVSHELRTPLNSIIGYSDLMLKGIGVEGPPLSDDSAYLTGRIKHNGKHLLHIINDILDVSKIEAKRVQVANAPFSPRDLLDWTHDELKAFADEKHLDLICMMDTNLPETIVGDENLLRRILVNLGSNAIKFTKEGAVTVSFARQTDRWQICVTDTGIGIPAEMREIIFQPFRQVDGSYQRQFGGTGLGLTICRNLAHLMGGEVQLQSEEGRGSTFTVTLPLNTRPALVEVELESTAL